MHSKMGGLMSDDPTIRWQAELDQTKAAVFDHGNGAFGAIVGSAVADAVGAGYEFTTGVNSIASDQIAPIGGGPFNWEPGQWTDDTEQAVALLDALSVSPDHNVTQAAKNVLSWYASEPADIGTTTLNVLRTALHRTQVEDADPVEACFTAARRHAVLRDTHRLDRSPILTTMQGCGGLMRLSSCSLLRTEVEAEEWAVATSMLTHGSVHVADLAATLGQLIWRASRLNGDPLDTIFSGVFNHLADETRAEWETLIQLNDLAADSSRSTMFVSFNGTAPGALVCALLSLIETTLIHGEYQHNPNLWFRRCVQRVVAQGGDTDSVAAIVGAIAGGVVGYRNLPEIWRGLLHGFNHEGTTLDEDDLLKLTVRALQRISANDSN